jgi:AAHS family 4-hydroxybenzoate transporter-like MFS transporter
MDNICDLRDMMDRQPIGRLQWLTIGLCGCVGVMDGFDLQAIGFLAPPMAASLHIDARAFGPVFAASLVGLMLGTLAMGPIGDRWGRKRSLVFAAVFFSVFAFATSFATTLPQLVAIRFLTGIGLGSAAPTVFAMVAEMSPRRLQRATACGLSAALPLGVVLAALVGSWMLPRWGWQSVFYVGGALPLVLAGAIAAWMPESVLFAAVNGASQPRLRALASRLWPASGLDERTRLEIRREPAPRAPIVALFREGRAFITLALWLTYAMNLLIIYFIVSWMPTILRAAELPQAAGLVAIMAFGAAGVVGSLVQGALITRYPAHRVMVAQFALYGLLAVLFPWFARSLALVALFSFAIGWAIQGAQAGLNAFASGFYPTAMRATGVGWGQGIGRLGSVVGPLLGGAAMQAGWTPGQIFMIGVVPAFVAALAVIAIAWRRAGLPAVARPAQFPI